MKNLFVLPTDKPSRLIIYSTLLNEFRLLDEPIEDWKHKKNICITSDEEIKDVRPHKGKWQLEKGEILNKFPDYLTDLSECKLVIMTTDQDLIKDGVQAIPDEFLEWFVKNPSCEEIETVFNNRGISGSEKILKSFGEYKIIIPKEEQKQETLEESKAKLFRYSEEEVRKIALDFFYHWWNSKGTNTEQGFDEWFEQNKKK